MAPSERGVVLLVEDNEELRNAVLRALRQAGYRVASAPDGRSAMRWLGEHTRPALILLDLWMPNTDGGGVRKEIASHPHLRDIPIIVMTAALQQTAEELNVKAVLEKPVTLTDLIATVEKYI